VHVSDKADNGVEVISLGYGRYQVIVGSRRLLAFAVVARDVWVFLDGRVYTITDGPAGGPRRSRSDDHAALTAPMPATVLAINVAPGQRVAQDDVVMLLEAMKMELPVKSPRDGVVKTVGCQVGELVQAGTTLLELEEPTDAVKSERIKR
jgi:acetyl/propionyl-CoA carboxylase alpha subunit